MDKVVTYKVKPSEKLSLDDRVVCAVLLDTAFLPIYPPILVPGGYCEIYASLKKTLDNILVEFNLPCNYTTSFFRAPNCYKFNQAYQDNYWTVNTFGTTDINLAPQTGQFAGSNTIDAYPAGYWQGDPHALLPGYYFHFACPLKILQINGLDVNQQVISGGGFVQLNLDGCSN